MIKEFPVFDRKVNFPSSLCHEKDHLRETKGKVQALEKERKAYLQEFEESRARAKDMFEKFQAEKAEKESSKEKNQALIKKAEELQDLCNQQNLRASEREKMLSLKVAELEEKLAWHEMGARPKTATFSVENEDIVKKDDQCRVKAAEKPTEAGSIIDQEPNPKAVPCSKKGASPKTVRFNLEHEYIIIEDYDSGQHEKPPKEQKCWKDFAEYADESIIEAQERRASGKGGMLSLNVANQIGFCPWTVIFNAAKEFSVINDDDALGQHEKPDIENPGQEEELGCRSEGLRDSLAQTGKESADGTLLLRWLHQMMFESAGYVIDFLFSSVHSQKNKLSTAPGFTQILENGLVESFKSCWGDFKISSLNLCPYPTGKVVNDDMEVFRSDLDLSLFTDSGDKLVDK
ncbi:hypothetical protein ABVT39_026149 [Epinephelus coioides]